MIDLKEKRKIRKMLEEDVGPGDITTKSVVSPDTISKAEVIAKQSGILAGAAEAKVAFKEMGVKAEAVKKDGARINVGDIVMKVEGPAYGILAAERTALNLMTRMSGVATATKKMIDIAREVNLKVKIAATRKTAPLLTSFDKRAVQIAGGEPHRFCLNDFILIKDNHLKLVGSVAEAVRRARKNGSSSKIEVEVNHLEDCLEAVKSGADVIMLDNFEALEVERTIETLKKSGLRDQIIIEASGGIDPSNVREYAAAGVDIISSSYMTMQAPALDMGLEINAGG
ncbi:hypothetical protein AKJ45_01480 [candidate division MSBL1 archaeon SCGC-AAA261F19]|uniref:Nicotinate-nucleotide pyrophosphorylase [carboxylating] n=1 Tax=candidate division MSBL1 archaeon SCGC-AAA261F19 TaxID=1698275 RepID=A0A133VAK3_9EURY|nr:hypothetical protein AKJ45_01480 [candidate division MSBL1 archaeon SCGC-AAA261F19]